jgi:hypothetical protein
MFETVSLFAVIILMTLVVTFFLFSFGSYLFGGPFLPSSQKVLAELFAKVPLELGSIFFDLGSGDGRVLIEAAKKGAMAVGYELNPFWYFVSYLRVRSSHLLNKITIRRENFMNAPLLEADVIYVYLYPQNIIEIEDYLKKGMKKGARVISYRYPFPDWKEEKKLDTAELYIYRKE